MMLFLGLMSGTSMDGIDVAIVELPSNRLIAGKTYPYAPPMKACIEGLTEKSTVEACYQSSRLLGEAFAKAALVLIQEAKLSTSDIRAIGSHGQTICHAPQANPAYTVQIGCGHTITALTGVPVVADFRVKDMVLGGQGAPFAPLYHRVLFEKLDKPLAVLNLGGIANLTYLRPEITGYDVGPGNVLMDEWASTYLGQPYDKDGAWAATGQMIPELLTKLLSDVFFKLPKPKSIGKEYYSAAWLAAFLKPSYKPEDVQATLLALTAKSIALDLENIQRVLVCGGGVHNSAFMKQLALEAPGVIFESTSAVGVNPDFIEAMMFAWLASKTIAGESVDLRPITGSKAESVLGCIYR